MMATAAEAVMAEVEDMVVGEGAVDIGAAAVEAEEVTDDGEERELPFLGQTTCLFERGVRRHFFRPTIAGLSGCSAISNSSSNQVNGKGA